MGDDLTLEGPLVVEVEVLQSLAGREPRCTDAGLTAVGFAGGDLALQAGCQELLMAPGLGPCSFGEPLDRRGQGRSLEHPGQIGQFGGEVAATAGLSRSHQATTPSTPSSAS